MGKNAIERLASLQNLRSTWEEFWKSGGKKQSSSGVDGITPAEFHKKLEGNLRLTRYKLLDGYEFDRLSAYPIPKLDGKTDRIICVPTVRDRLVQRSVGMHLSGRAERIGILNDASYGFIPGRGVTAARDRAIRLRRAYPWVYKSDITAFFDRVRRDLLFDEVVRKVRTPSIHPILNAAIHCEIDTRMPSKHRKVSRAGIQAGKGIRQGMPLSPFFANIMLIEFDKFLLKRGCVMIRYADDFIIFSSNEAGCYEADSICRDVLGSIGFDIPEVGDDQGKTAIKNPDEGVEFLGMELSPSSSGGYSLRISDKQMEKINRQINQLKDVEYLKDKDININNLIRMIENKIGGFRSSYAVASNYDELDKILIRSRSKTLSEIFTNIFGHDAVSNLTISQKRFLCLDS